jgi:hypothetical protein
MTVTQTAGAQFDFGRVISRTSGLVGRNFAPFFVLSVIFAGLPYAVIQLIQAPLIYGNPSAAGVVAVAATLVSFLTSLLLQGTLTRASIDDLSGKPVSIGSALSAGIALLLPLFGLGLLVGLGIVGGLILLIVPGVYLALRWSVASPVLVAERTGITAAMGRSAVLTENHRWAIFGLFVVLLIFIMVVSLVIGILVGGGLSAFAGAGLQGEAPPILFVIIMTGVQSIISMIATVGVAAVYFELRQIKEGVGVAEIAKIFD